MKLETFFNKIVKKLSFCENLQEVIDESLHFIAKQYGFLNEGDRFRQKGVRFT